MSWPLTSGDDKRRAAGALAADHPGLDRWLDLYQAVARSNGAFPDGGRLLKGWALEAGFTDVACTVSGRCFAAPEERAWWGSLWADRIRKSSFAEHALERVLTSREELEELAVAWHAWIAAEDGWFGVLNSEILCRD